MSNQRTIAELKVQDPARYKREYEKYVEEPVPLVRRRLYPRRLHHADAGEVRHDCVGHCLGYLLRRECSMPKNVLLWRWLEITDRAESHLPVYLWGLRRPRSVSD